MIYKLSFREGRAVGPGSLLPYPTGEPRKDKALVGFEQVTFLIHGFNVDEADGECRLSNMAHLIPAAYPGAVVFVLWPGDSPIGPLSYSFTEGYQADDTAFNLSRIIESHVAQTTPINFIAHSMGCRITMETLKNLNKLANGRKEIYPVNQVCLMAAAMDNYSLSAPMCYKAAAERAGRVVVLSSVKDNTLRWIYPLGDLVQAFLFFWKETGGLALGYRGPINFQQGIEEESSITFPIPDNIYHEPIDKNHNVDHGDYLPSDPIEIKQQSAASFANAVIAGKDRPAYRLG